MRSARTNQMCAFWVTFASRGRKRAHKPFAVTIGRVCNVRLGLGAVMERVPHECLF